MSVCVAHDLLRCYSVAVVSGERGEKPSPLLFYEHQKITSTQSSLHRSEVVTVLQSHAVNFFCSA